MCLEVELRLGPLGLETVEERVADGAALGLDLALDLALETDALRLATGALLGLYC